VDVSWENCEVNRTYGWTILKTFMDSNGDGNIGLTECKNAIDNLTKHDPPPPFIAEMITEISNFFIKDQCLDFFEKCDFDEDGVVTSEDFDLSDATCLQNCRSVKRMAFLANISIAEPSEELKEKRRKQQEKRSKRIKVFIG
jgi:hypothetical protein